MSRVTEPRRERWRRGRRAAVAGFLSVALAVLAVGCGSSGPTTTSSAATQNATDPGVTAAFAYARCMRSHGVSDFPDPKVISGPSSRGIVFHLKQSDAASPSLKGASQACQSILPAPTNASPAEQRARKNGLLAFARCMRAKGIAGFPDPDLQGRLSLQMVSAAGIDIHSRQVLDTAKACVGVSNGAIKLADVEAAINGAH